MSSKQGGLPLHRVCVSVRERERERGAFTLGDTKPNIMAIESGNLQIAEEVIYCNHCGCHRLSDNSLHPLCQQRLPGRLSWMVTAMVGRDRQASTVRGREGWGPACCQGFPTGWRPHPQNREATPTAQGASGLEASLSLMQIMQLQS